MLYYNDENLMFASLASNRRQTVFRLRAEKSVSGAGPSD